MNALVIFPSDFEAQGFLLHLKKLKKNKHQDFHYYTGILDDLEITAPIVGVGGQRASRRTEALLELSNPEVMFLAGFAGSLVPQITKGQIILAQNGSSEDLVNYFKLVHGFVLARLFTSDIVLESPEQKRAIAREKEAQVVDMEMDYLAFVATKWNIPIATVRIISDDLDDVLPEGFSDAAIDPNTGFPSALRLLPHLIANPGRIFWLQKFISRLKPLRNQLGDFLVILLKELDS